MPVLLGTVLAFLASSDEVRSRISNSPSYAWLARKPVLEDVLPRPLLNERLVTGILVTGTPAAPVVYVSSSDPRIGGGLHGGKTRSDTNSGVISRLTRTTAGWKRVDLMRGLPRSRHDHAPNGLALDERRRVLYLAQGSNTNMGAPSRPFDFPPEYALSGAILAIDLDRLRNRTYDLPTLDDDTRPGNPDEGDPFGGNLGNNQATIVPGAPIRVHAAGLRNAYDLVLTRAGRIYTVDNGANGGWGATPHGEGPGGRCTNERSEGGMRELDVLQLVAPKGHYGGHPNPTRGNQANTFNEDRQSPVPVANPVECDARPPGAGDGAVTTFSPSTNGIAEYRATNLGEALKGDLLLAGFDGKIYRVKLDRTGRRAILNKPLFDLEGVALDVVALPDEAPFPGTIWIADWVAGKIVVFEPKDYESGRVWRERPPTGVRRQEVSFVEARGRLYLTGGGRRHEVYEPATGSWRDVAPLPATIDHVQGVEVGGRIYYVGGLAAWPGPHVSTVSIYDPATNRFSRGASMPRGRGAGGVAAHGGKIYYAGGLHDGRAVPWLDVYDPASDTWSQLPDMPRPRDHFHAAVVDGKLYVIGGRNRDIDATTPATDVYDIRRGRWEAGRAPLPTSRGGFGVAVVGPEILVIGGEGKGVFATVEAYNTVTDSWRVLPPMPTPRHGIQAAVCGGEVHVAAGGAAVGGGEPTNVHEALVVDPSARCGRPEPKFERRRRSVTSADFRRIVLEGAPLNSATSLQFGPDGRLYVAQQEGLIKVYSVVRTPRGRYRVTSTETIETVQDIANHDDDGRPAARPFG